MSRKRKKRSLITISGGKTMLCDTTPVVIDWGNDRTQHCLLVTPTNKKERQQ